MKQTGMIPLTEQSFGMFAIQVHYRVFELICVTNKLHQKNERNEGRKMMNTNDTFIFGFLWPDSGWRKYYSRFKVRIANIYML